MKLENIEKAFTKNNTVYYKLTIDGKQYNYFGELDGIVVGDSVICEFETKGKFTNLKAISKGNAERSVAQCTDIQLSHAVVLNKNENPDSIELGTPGKLGAIKVYGDFNNPEDFKLKIQSAIELRAFFSESLPKD